MARERLGRPERRHAAAAADERAPRRRPAPGAARGVEGGVMRTRLVVVLVLAAGLVAGGCTAGRNALSRRDDCTVVDVATSPEKLALLTELAREFNEDDIDGKCVEVKVARKASGAGAQLLSDDWPDEEANGPKPVIWSPAASSWGSVVNQRR